MDNQQIGSRQLVVARVGDTYCGIDIEHVQEIIPLPEITAIPKSPLNLIGVINVRNVVIPVADLRACLGFQPSRFTGDTRIVLVKHRGEPIGLVVDTVSEVATLPAEAFETIEHQHGNSRFLRAIARFQGRLVLEIDHARVIEDGLNTPVAAAAPDRAILAQHAPAVAEAAARDSTLGQPPLRVDLIEESFKLVAPQAELIADRFYERLFETAPEARGLFPAEMSGQKRALMAALGTIVSHLRRPELLEAYVSGLGERHAGYGAVPEHYDVVGATLLDTLAEVAGDAWNEAYATAWGQAFSATRDMMLAAAGSLPAKRAA